VQILSKLISKPHALFHDRLISMKRTVAISLIVLLIGGVLLMRRQERAPSAPLHVGIWYWHTPFRIPRTDRDYLQRANIREIYVRSGTFTWRTDKAQLIIPQVWAGSSQDVPVHLVFNFDYTIAPRFGKIPNDVLAQAVITGVRAERKKAEQAGVKVVGIQFDLDCPTKRLPKYAELLKVLRTALRGEKTALSITGLPTWFGSRELEQVVAQTDFWVPQYYESDMALTLAEDRPLSHRKQVVAGLRGGERFATPFAVGIPAYGHARLYDDKGKLRGLFKEMPIDAMLRHPAFRHDRSFAADANAKPATPQTFIGEEIHQFTAIRPAQNGEGKGFRVLYDLPTPELVAQHLELIRRERPANCRGVVLFRYPQQGETMTLSWASLQAALNGQPAAPHLRVDIKVESLPWDVIETESPNSRPPIELTVSVTNDGNARAFLGKDAVTLTLIFAHAAIEETEQGEFDSLVTHRLSSSDAVPTGTTRASLRFANAIHVTRKSLGVGETVDIGTMRLRGEEGATVRGWWTIKGTGGFREVRGNIPVQKILSETGRKNSRP
jgi:hypothetical protein